MVNSVLDAQWRREEAFRSKRLGVVKECIGVVHAPSVVHDDATFGNAIVLVLRFQQRPTMSGRCSDRISDDMLTITSSVAACGMPKGACGLYRWTYADVRSVSTRRISRNNRTDLEFYGPDVRQSFQIIQCGLTVCPYHTIEFFLCCLLDVRVGQQKDERVLKHSTSSITSSAKEAWAKVPRHTTV